MSEKVNEEYDNNWAIDLGNVPYEMANMAAEQEYEVTAKFDESCFDQSHFGTVEPMDLHHIPANNNIEFSCIDSPLEGAVITIDCMTGELKLGEGIEIEDASELFWTVLAGDSPMALRKQLEEAEETIASLMVWKSLWQQNLEAKLKLATMEDDSDGNDYDRAMKVIS